MSITSLIISGAIGLVSGLVMAYVAMRIRLREERAKWKREIALKYVEAQSTAPTAAAMLTKEFGPGIVVVDTPGELRRKHFIPTGGRLVIGRSGDADININDPFLSRQHFAFEDRSNGVFVIDFHTHGGTILNGEPITAAVRLKTGDVLSIGDTKITFVALS
jgi:pSer/pThr/pTyr-binding forkhead associated (FHA) protein